MALLIVLAPICLVVTQSLLHATNTITVNTTDDPGTSSECSLRAAILNANAAGTVAGSTCAAGSGNDTINFSVSGTITLGSGTPAIANTLTVDGTGQSITVDGASTFQVFVVNGGATLNLKGLTIAHGHNPSNGPGGGVLNNGTLTVANCTFSANITQFGGGIANHSTASVSNSIFSGNSAGGTAGAILNDNNATMTIANSTFSENSTTSNGSGAGITNNGTTLMVTDSAFFGNTASGQGGGIENNGGGLTVSNSTFSGNSASVGGGLAISGNGGTVTIGNSTFSGNSASSTGGGINIEGGMLTVTNSTFSGNSAAATAGGGAIANLAGTLAVTNSALANSTSGGNCSGKIGDSGHNIDDAATCGFTGTNCTNTTGTSFCNTNPLLSAAGLQFNGGRTQTIVLQSTSPAIDAVPVASCPTDDQRGLMRPDSPIETACDIGAFESGESESCVSPPSGLVSWWPGDGNSNDVVGSNNGTAHGGLAFAAGEVGQSFSFNGTDAYVDFGNAPSLEVSSGDFTVDAWVMFNSLSSSGGPCSGGSCDESILDKMSGLNQDGWRLLKQQDNHFWFCFGGGTNNGCQPNVSTTVRSQTVATTETFYHVTGVKTSNAISIYVNGELEASTPLGAFTDTNSTDLLAGSTATSSGTAMMDGLVDEIELFDRALSATEIQSIVDAGPAGKCKSTPTPTATSTSTSTATATASPTSTPTQTPTLTATATPTATRSPTPTATATVTATRSATATQSATSTPTRTATSTATTTRTATPTATATATATATNTATPTATATPGLGKISVKPKKLNLRAAPGAMATGTITISNTGTGPLTANVTAPKHNPPFTELNGGSGIPIDPGAMHDVTIVYSPANKGSTSDDVVITSTGTKQKVPINVKIEGRSK